MSWKDTFREIADRAIPKGDPDVVLAEKEIENGRFVVADAIIRKWIGRINTPESSVRMEPEHVNGLRLALDHVQASNPRTLAPQH